MFWCVFKNAWATILAYHAQILFWSRGRLRDLVTGWDSSLFLRTALPLLAAGPVTYLVLPHATGHTELGAWLAGHGLTGIRLSLMIPYFGLVHPLLEQAHWSDLRANGWSAHAAFAGYHAIVLGSLLTLPWLALCIATLYLASAMWAFVQARMGQGLLLPVCGHILADVGIILAAWARVS